VNKAKENCSTILSRIVWIRVLTDIAVAITILLLLLFYLEQSSELQSQEAAQEHNILHEKNILEKT